MKSEMIEDNKSVKISYHLPLFYVLQSVFSYKSNHLFKPQGVQRMIHFAILPNHIVMNCTMVMVHIITKPIWLTYITHSFRS